MKYWFSILCFLLGLAVGVSIASRSRPPRLSSGAQSVAPTLPTPTLRKTPAPQSIAALQIEKPPYRDRLNAISDLNTVLRVKIAVPMLMGEAVNEDFVKVYGMSAAEVEQLKAAFAGAKTRIAELEAKYASIVPKGENAFTISIPPFPKEGGNVYDALLQSIHDVLGDERFSAYRATGTDLDSTMFGMFGLSETTIELRSLKEGEKPTASSSSNFEPGGTLKVHVDTIPRFFQTDYPAIYQKMVASGLWKANTQ